MTRWPGRVQGSGRRKKDEESQPPRNWRRRAFGKWSVPLGIVAAVFAVCWDSEGVTDALRTAVTPLAVVQGIVLISIMRPTDGDPSDEHGTVRVIAAVCVGLSTGAVGLILFHIAVPAGIGRTVVGAFAAFVTVPALSSLLRIDGLRELVREARSTPAGGHSPG